MTSPEITGRVERRTLDLDLRRARDSERSVAASLSSEKPVVRGWGVEVLRHDAKSIVLDRAGAGLSIVIGHDASKLPIGKAERLRITEKRLRADLRFGSGWPEAESAWAAVAGGIADKVSISYQIHEVIEDGKDAETGIPRYLVTKWEPLEVSLVAIPADETVGVGRSRPAPRKEVIMETKIPPRIESVESDAVVRERDRVEQIRAIGENAKQRELAAQFISSGGSVEDFRAAVIERMAAAQTPLAPIPPMSIGLRPSEVSNYSLRRLVNALANPADRRAQADAAFEFEVSSASLATQGRALRGGAAVTIPLEVLGGRRDLLVGTATLGGNLVQTDLLAGDFIEAMRNKALVIQAGATVINGLVGNVAIPKRTGTSVGYWVAEGSAPTESTAVTFGQVTMTPKTIGAFVDYSRKTLLQTTPGIEALMRSDLMEVLGLAIDAAAINGAGTAAEPGGILPTTAIGTSSMGAQAAALTWAAVVAAESAVAGANGDGSKMAYMTSPAVRGSAKTIVKGTAGQLGYIWNENLPERPLNGYPCYVTNQVPTNLTYGTTTGSVKSMIFGDWSQLVIGYWSGVDILIDPYTASSSGTVRIVALQDVDIAFRQTAAFNKILGIS